MEPEFDETVAKNLLIAFLIGCGIDKKDIKDSNIKINKFGDNGYYMSFTQDGVRGKLEYGVSVIYTNTDAGHRMHITTNVAEHVGYVSWDEYYNTISELNQLDD